MCDWRRWIWPGIIATLVLCVLAVFVRQQHIETELSALAGAALAPTHSWAAIELDGRDLTLTGLAPSEAAQADAVKIARATYDVRVVNNKTSLIDTVEPYVFSAIKAPQGVTLSGHVPDEAARAEIVAKAQAAMPGFTVTDQLTIARGAPAGFAGLAGFALEQLARLTTGDATLSNTELVLNGVADTAETFAAAQAALAVLPEGLTIAASAITQPLAEPVPEAAAPEPAPEPAAPAADAVSPYTWSATSKDGIVRLEGYAPSADAAAANVAEAEKLGVTVEDEQQIAPGAPAAYAAATAYGIQSLADLAGGAASLTDSAMAITGDVADLATKLEMEANLPAAAPEGIKLSAALTAPQIANYKWQAVKSVGGVTLSGFVPSVEAKALSVRKAASVAEPVRDVQVLGAGAPGNYAAVVTTALDALKPLTKGTATLDNNMLTVAGIAPDLGTELRVEAALAKAGFRYDIISPAVSPYVWKAEKTADAIVLSGLAPSPEMQSFNVKKAGNTTANVMDNQALANGAPANYSAATVAGLSALGQLLVGTADYTDGQLSVTGSAATQAIKTGVENALAAAGFTGTITAPAGSDAAPAAAKTDGANASCPDLVKSVTGARNINFETDSAVIADARSAELDAILLVAKSCPDARFAIEGHTDNRARDAYNQALSEARAAAVKNWMVERGLPADRFETAGFGETKPVADNASSKGRALNRRIEIRVLN